MDAGINGEGNSPLAGAVFGLFRNSVTDYTTTPLMTATSNADGVFMFEGVQFGTYKVVELTPPDGYEWRATSGEPVWVVTVSLTNRDVYVNNGNAIRNFRIPATIIAHKEDEDGNPVYRAAFGLYRADNDALYQTAYSMADGTITFTGVVWPAQYYIRELFAPAGYWASNATMYVDVPNTGTYEVTTAFVNTHKTGSIYGHKVNEVGANLAGAKFGLFYPATEEFTEANALMTATSGVDGIFRFNDVRYGDYIVVELEAPTGYIASGTHHPVTVDDNNVEVNLGNIVNTNDVGTITGRKVDPNNRPMQGVPFGLFATGTTEFTSRTAIAVATTDSDGVFTFANLPYGTYLVREITPSSGDENDIRLWRAVQSRYPNVGYNETVYTVVLGPTGQNIEINVTNPKLSGAIKIKKVNHLGEPLAGVTFELWAYTTTTTEAPQAIALIGEKTTDENGECIWEDLDYGHYYAIETATVEGYALSNEPHYADVTEHLVTITITVVNNPSPRYIDVTKRIRADEINWANGNPIFIFVLTNTPASVGNETYYHAFEFTQAYVEAYTSPDGWVEMTHRFDNLAPDQYVVYEREPMRYKFEGIDEVINGTTFLNHPTYGNCVVFELAKKEYGACRYTNRIKRWDNPSDTAIVINHFGS